MFNVIGHFVLHEQTVSQIFGHKERRRVIGFWFDVGEMRWRGVRVAAGSDRIRHWKKRLLAVRRLLLRVKVGCAANIFLQSKTYNYSQHIDAMTMSIQPDECQLSRCWAATFEA